MTRARDKQIRRLRSWSVVVFVAGILASTAPIQQSEAAALATAPVETSVATSGVSTSAVVDYVDSATSDTVVNPDGTFTATVSTVPTRYLDDRGELQPIDEALEASTDPAVSAESAANDFTISIPTNPSEDPITYEANGATISMRMHGLNSREMFIQDDRAVFSHVDNADRVEYEVTPEGLKEEIILDHPPAGPLSYKYTVGASNGIEANLRNGEIIFSGPDGTTVATIPPGVMYDASGESSHLVSYSIRDQGDDWLLSVEPGANWLASPDRQYPVIVDPTLSKQNASADCWVRKLSPTSTHCGATNLFIKAGATQAGDEYRGLVKFDLSGIPADATVTYASMLLFQESTQSFSNNTIELGVSLAGKNWDSSATWNSSGASGAWTGGNPETSTYANISTTGANSQNRQFAGNLGQLVQSLVNLNKANRGFVLRPVNGSAGNVVGFYSGSGPEGKRPTLTVDFTLPPRVLSQSASPCYGTCDPDWLLTSTPTPMLTAVLRDTGSATNAQFEVRKVGSSALSANSGVISASATAPSVVSWQVPTGQLERDTQYEMRVRASDTSGSNWSSWVPLGVMAEAQAPTLSSPVAVSPCIATCSDLVTTSLAPVFSASASDSDSALLKMTWTLRPLADPSALITGEEIVGESAPAEFAPGVLSSGDYELKLDIEDGTSSIAGTWIPVSVVPPTSGPSEPQSLSISPCSDQCSEWATTTTTPEFSADFGSSPVTAIFEVRSDESTYTQEVPTATGEVRWAVPQGVLATNMYDARVGASSAGTVRWTAWRNFSVDLEADPLAAWSSIDGPEVMPGATQPSPTLTPEEQPQSDPYDDSDLAKLTEQQEAADLAGETSSVPVWQRFAPVMYLHPDERFFPLSPDAFTGNSRLIWSHGGACRDHVAATDPSGSGLGNGAWNHQSYGFDCFNHSGTRYYTNGYVGPKKAGGPDGNDGWYLDLYNSLRDGDGLSGREPVYYRFRDAGDIRYLQYFTPYGYSKVPILRHGHEGDWESIAIRLNRQTNEPKQVQYFFHHDSCILPWEDVPKQQKTHPRVVVALESHGSYPPGAIPPLNFGLYRDKLKVGVDRWYANNELREVTDAPWYGYGGLWGENGNSGNFSGPLGPGPARNYDSNEDPPSFTGPRCNMG